MKNHSIEKMLVCILYAFSAAALYGVFLGHVQHLFTFIALAGVASLMTADSKKEIAKEAKRNVR